MTNPGMLPVTVVIPAHTEARWLSLVACVESVRQQVAPPASIIVAVDHNESLFSRASQSLENVHVVPSRYARGASGTRNAGVESAATELVAFVDSDVTARPDWLLHLVAPFDRPSIMGVGGAVFPKWLVGKPAWFPDEFGWVVGATGGTLSLHGGAVRNVWSESMAVRRDMFAAVGGFRVGFGKVGDRPRPEDTDLCVRMSRAFPQAEWFFTSNAIVDHDVGPERSRFTFFLRRCYAEGRGKVDFDRLNEGEGLEAEYDYIRSMISHALSRYLAAAVLHFQPASLARATAVLCGVAAAAVGATVGRIHPARSNY